MSAPIGPARSRALQALAVTILLAGLLAGLAACTGGPPPGSASSVAPSAAPSVSRSGSAPAIGEPTAPAAGSPTSAPEPSGRPSRAAPAVPADSGTGRRIVWSKSANRVWLVTGKGRVAATFQVVDNDRKTPTGRYRIQRRNYSARSFSGSALDQFLGFYQRPGHTAWIGLHAVPRRAGHYTRALGSIGPGGRQTPGCVYESPQDAKTTWKFARIGTPVTVVP
jgi:hypothetical protein